MMSDPTDPFLAYLTRRRPETKEERAARERREKQARLQRRPAAEATRVQPDPTRRDPFLAFAELAANLAPVTGEALAARDFVNAVENRDLLGGALAGIGMLPAVGMVGRTARVAGRAARAGGDAAQSLDELLDVIRKSGVDIELYHPRGDQSLLELSKIVVPRDARNAGLGSAAMQRVLDYADATGARVALTPSADFGGSVPRLRKFYRGFGFVDNAGRGRDFSTRESMIRLPAPR